MFNDKRKAIRRPMRYTAWVAQKGKPLHGCVVADISDTGARLDIENGESLPNEFVLLLSSRGAARRKCRVVWRRPRQIGVEFSQSRGAKANAVIRAMMKNLGKTEATAQEENAAEPTR